MSHLIVLGSSNAIPTPGHENTHLVLVTANHTVLVDCASNPVVRMEQAGLQLNDITDIILTHFHPDHVAGIPLLLMDMWLMGRRQPLNIFGLDYTLERVDAMMALFGWTGWPNFFPVIFQHLPAEENALALDSAEVRIRTTPVKHFLPNIGIRFDLKAEGKSLAYSCDTEPCPAMQKLAQDVDILIHEASGPFTGHSSATQAATIARDAGAGALYLIHYPTGRFASGNPLAEAQTIFPREVTLCTDLMRIDL